MAIPFNITNPKPQPLPPKVEIPPTEEKLKLLIANGAIDVARAYIDKFKMKLIVTDEGVLKDSLLGTELWLNKFITNDPHTLQQLDEVRKLAKCDDEVLITGETGVGKETIARAMIGDRSGMFMAVNCAGLPEQLVESELFGYKKGSFTGADGDREGMMAKAKNGVLFLDEAGDLPLAAQAKLLRALQEKKIRRVGGIQEEDISCKVVCGTWRNVKKMVDEGTFRKDLYARISTFEVHIKPLREREDDVIPIIESLKGGKELLKAMAEQNLRVKDLDLSLNVRSLIQVVRRYTVLGRVIV